MGPEPTSREHVQETNYLISDTWSSKTKLFIYCLICSKCFFILIVSNKEVTEESKWRGGTPSLKRECGRHLGHTTTSYGEILGRQRGPDRHGLQDTQLLFREPQVRKAGVTWLGRQENTRTESPRIERPRRREDIAAFRSESILSWLRILEEHDDPSGPQILETLTL